MSQELIAMNAPIDRFNVRERLEQYCVSPQPGFRRRRSLLH